MDGSVYSPWLIELQNQIKFEENSFASTKIRIIFFEYLGLITLIKEYSMNEIFPGTYQRPCQLTTLNAGKPLLYTSPSQAAYLPTCFDVICV